MPQLKLKKYNRMIGIVNLKTWYKICCIDIDSIKVYNK